MEWTLKKVYERYNPIAIEGIRTFASRSMGNSKSSFTRIASIKKILKEEEGGP